MTPFLPATYQLPPVREFLRGLMDQGQTREQAKRVYREMKASKVYRNDMYQVVVRELPEGFTHLSIKRNDRDVCRDWRDFQRIKNELCGPEREGFEMYPAESRLVDGANQYHLWVLPLGLRIPLGFDDGRQVYDGPSKFGEVQRPLEQT